MPSIANLSSTEPYLCVAFINYSYLIQGDWDSVDQASRLHLFDNL